MSTTVKEIEKAKTGDIKSPELCLDSLEIKGYRCFEHLTVEKLGRVNLIVGKNNVGKTALLEALWIYSRRGFFQFIFDNLSSRNEMIMTHGSNDDPNELNERIKELRNIFYARNEVKPGQNLEATIGSIKKQNSNLKFGLEWHSKKPLKNIDDYELKENELFSDKGQSLYFVRNVCGSANYSNPIKTFNNIFWNWEKLVESDLLKCQFIETKGLKDNYENKLWDNIVLTPLEDKLINSLKIIQPNIGRIAFTNQSRNRIGLGDSVWAVATLNDSNDRISIKSLGEGMSRMLRIALALTNCQNGILLIDEVENGFHYSILPDVWKLIFKTAKELNVQVFATTHSKDCVEAFAAAAAESPEDGILIRLERQDGKVVAKAIEGDMLVDAVNYEVEVR